MKFQELLLAAREASNVDSPYNVDAHALERRKMRYWRYNESSVVFKSDEPAVEKMIDTGR